MEKENCENDLWYNVDVDSSGKGCGKGEKLLLNSVEDDSSGMGGGKEEEDAAGDKLPETAISDLMDGGSCRNVWLICDDVDVSGSGAYADAWEWEWG